MTKIEPQAWPFPNHPRNEVVEPTTPNPTLISRPKTTINGTPTDLSGWVLVPQIGTKVKLKQPHGDAEFVVMDIKYEATHGIAVRGTSTFWYGIGCVTPV